MGTSGIRPEKSQQRSRTPDVFISHRSSDFHGAKRVYDYLTEHGKSVFLSEVSIPSTGRTDFMREIDEALEAATNLFVVCSSATNVTSGWVEAEWRVFIKEKREGRKSGNVLTILLGDMAREHLPMSLRYYEIIELREDSDFLNLLKFT